VDTDLSGAALLTVSNSATLAGAGTIGLCTNLTGATLSPGSAVGTLTVASNLYFDADSTIAFDVGTSSDLITFSSAGDWLAGSGTNITLALSTNAGFSHLNTYTIFTNVTTTGFGVTNITGYDTANYTASFAKSGNAYALSFVASSASYVVSETSLTVTENGNNTFTVVPAYEPTNNVVFDIVSDNTPKATVSPAQLTFTTGNWETPQTITVSGQDDADTTNDSAVVTVSINQAGTLDADYDPLASKTVAIAVQDDDSGFTVSPTALTITENNVSTGSFTVVLDSQPSSDVVFTISSSDDTEATTDVSQLTFTSGNYDTPQTVEVTGPDDAATGDDSATITVSVDDANSDDAFDALPDQTVAVTIYDDENLVTTTADSGAGSLRTVVGNASANQTVRFLSGLGKIVLTGSYITIDKNLSISDPEGDVIIDGNANGRIFYGNGAYDLDFIGLTLTNATVDGLDGAGMLFHSAPTVVISNCAFRACTVTGSSFVDYGGAIHYQGGLGSLTIKNTTFDSCSAVGDGGAVNLTSCSRFNMDTVTFTNNTCGSEGQGGAVYFAVDNHTSQWKTVTFAANGTTGSSKSGGAAYIRGQAGSSMAIYDCTFRTNTTADGGGAAVFFGYIDSSRTDVADCVFSNCTFDFNAAQGDGGAVYALGEAMTFVDCTFSNNSANGNARYGGAIFLDDGGGSGFWGDPIVAMDHCIVASNSAYGGGGLYVDDDSSLTVFGGTQLSGNLATATNGLMGGGGIGVGPYSDAILVISNSSIYGNSSQMHGGGIFSRGVISLAGVTVSNNTARSTGGGILQYSQHDAALNECSVVDNISRDYTESGMFGGGGLLLRDTGTMTISNCTVSGNEAHHSGGGLVSLYDASVLKVVNTTFSGNSATNSNADGGAFAFVDGASRTVTIHNSTIFDNSCGDAGGGIFRGNGSVSLYSTIIAGNAAGGSGPDMNGTIAVLDHSLVENTTGYTASSSSDNVEGVSPLLNSLYGNGGPTLTHQPQSTSPAIDAGANPLGLTYDQRGSEYPRTHNLVSDIGAVERVPGGSGSIFRFK